MTQLLNYDDPEFLEAQKTNRKNIGYPENSPYQLIISPELSLKLCTFLEKCAVEYIGFVNT